MTIITQVVDLLNGSSKSMKVNGSVTPQEFSYSPGNGTVEILAIAVALADDAASDWTKFGALTGLTNGLLLEFVPDGSSATTLMVIKDNADMAVRFHKVSFGPSLVSALGALLGFGGTQFNFIGLLELTSPLSLTGNDAIRATVRDNLAGLVNFNMSLVVRREV